MLIGYVRVSTAGQDYETQKEALIKAGCDPKNIHAEKATGTNRAARPVFKNLQDNVLRESDTLVVTKIDRLARSIIDLNNIVKELNEGGVSVQFVGENIEFKAGKDTSPVQTLLFNVLGSFAQFERDLIVNRTSEGRERARRQGKHLGRPSQPKQSIEQALQLYDERESNGMSVNDITKVTGIPRSTIYHELKKRGE